MASVAIRNLSSGERVYYAQVKRDGKWTWVPTGIHASDEKSKEAAIAVAMEKQKLLDIESGEVSLREIAAEEEAEYQRWIAETCPTCHRKATLF